MIMTKYEKYSAHMGLGQLLFSDYLSHRFGTDSSNHHHYSLVEMFHDLHFKEFITPSVRINFRDEMPEEFYEKIFL